METLNRFDKSLSGGLALFSLVLGAAEMFAPHRVSRAIGVRPQPKLLRALGSRELVNGAAMLAWPASPLGPSARLLGDVMDMAALARARRTRFGGRTKF